MLPPPAPELEEEGRFPVGDTGVRVEMDVMVVLIPPSTDEVISVVMTVSTDDVTGGGAVVFVVVGDSSSVLVSEVVVGCVGVVCSSEVVVVVGTEVVVGCSGSVVVVDSGGSEVGEVVGVSGGADSSVDVGKVVGGVVGVVLSEVGDSVGASAGEEGGSVSVGAVGTSVVETTAFGSEVALGEPSVLVLLAGVSMVNMSLLGCDDTGICRATKGDMLAQAPHGKETIKQVIGGYGDGNGCGCVRGHRNKKERHD